MPTILHVDMDAFFASVELLRHPEWRGKPLIVGAGPSERGVVSTCSYEARAFGVHSAMPSRTAYTLCPKAIFVEPHMDLYTEVSEKAFEVFRRFTPYVEGVSIDEAFLDITGSLHLYGNDARRLGESLRAMIKAECGVTCSVGIAPNRLLAKIGSEQQKPNGLTLMPFEPAEIAALLAKKPVGILWGIGRQTEELLAPYGIKTCGDLQHLDFEALKTILGSVTAAEKLQDYAFGRDSSTVAWERVAEKSVSREYTFTTDEPCRTIIRAKLLELVTEVGQRFRAEDRWALTARIKIRDRDFNTCTRQTAFASPARDDISFREKALELFDAAIRPSERLAVPLRLIGFGVTNICSSPDATEPSLFATEENAQREKRERLSSTLDALRQKGLIV